MAAQCSLESPLSSVIRRRVNILHSISYTSVNAQKNILTLVVNVVTVNMIFGSMF